MREMKDSGISWVGLVPCDWDVKPIRAVFEEVTRKNKDGAVKTVLKFTYGTIVRKHDFDADEDSYVADTILNYTVVEPGTIMLNGLNLNFDFVSQRIGLVKEQGVITSAYMAFVSKDTEYMLPEYATYLLKGYDGCKALHNMGGGVRKILNFAEFQRYYVVIPQLSEQVRIVAFLDGKCAEIDALTADIQTQIDTLEQYKRSVITETVTKGLNPDAEMKDSGIEWIGVIPNEWAIRKGKYMFTQRSLRGNSAELQLLSPTQKFGVIPQTLYEELSGMTAVKLNEKADLNTLKTIHKGDFCISLRSFQGGFEYCEYEGVVSPAYQVFCPTVPIADGYYKYLFKESGFIEKMNSYTMTLRDGKNIAFSDFGNTYIPYPPVEIQSEIALHLDKRCSEINKVIMDKQAQLVTLDEYKKSLIFEYVTGKSEVPNEYHV